MVVNKNKENDISDISAYHWGNIAQEFVDGTISSHIEKTEAEMADGATTNTKKICEKNSIKNRFADCIKQWYNEQL